MTCKHCIMQMNDDTSCHCPTNSNNKRLIKQIKTISESSITLALAIIICHISTLNLIVQASNNPNTNNKPVIPTNNYNPTDPKDLKNQLLLSDAINGPGENFPGVSKDVAAFCSARPLLQIDMASMIVHVKRNASFNYKLYLFSEDYVFQTGQIVPRDDFRIHAFPVKTKRLRDFWPSDVSTFEEGLNSLKPIGSELFQYHKFFASVPMNPTNSAKISPVSSVSNNNNNINLQENPASNSDPIASSSNQAEPIELSGNPRQRRSYNNRDSASSVTTDRSRLNLNENIQFDRDDQVSLVSANTPLQIVSNNKKQEPVNVVPNASAIAAALRLRNQDSAASDTFEPAATGQVSADDASTSTANGKSGSPSLSMSESYRDTQTIIPVGAFSSFHVNITYYVRKDFGQLKPDLIKVGISANSFKVSYVTLIRDLARGPNNEHSSDDYQFLNHKLLSDPNTRITAISQIYHDWITRNFYTVVYIQRLHQLAHFEPGDLSSEETIVNNQQQSSSSRQPAAVAATISNDRLIFRGSSANLLGAVQLDYGVRASAFITDKNGLHYFLDFLSSSNKFYIAAVDWTEKPFKFIDSQRFPIKVTRTLLDNEELLLCPPAFCHSVSPVDELVAYGRLGLDDDMQLATSVLSGDFTSPSLPNSTQLDMENVIKSVQQAAASELRVKLHLRDWIWELEQPMQVSSVSSRNLQRRNSSPFTNNNDHTHTKANLTSSLSSSPFLTLDLPAEDKLIVSAGRDDNRVAIKRQHRPFSWRYKLAQRNDIKARNDIYGFPLTGNNIDAAFRVYNKLHLISANFLITINYAQTNETQITKRPIGDEFQQLSSTIIDPISAVFYDRYANQVFFFKGDRYIGYDYATRKPIEDFLLNDNTKDGAPMALSSLPVIGILGRQHSVDGIYHDLATDLVHIFEGMKFYSYEASQFKSGSFRSETSQRLPPMRCINTHFLKGCHFDKAFPNPCRESKISASPSSQDSADSTRDSNSSRNGKSLAPAPINSLQQQEQHNQWSFVPSGQSNQFIGSQQEKVRELAKSKLVEVLGKENSFNPNASQDIRGYVGFPSEPNSVGDQFGRVIPIAAAEQQLDLSSSRRHEKVLIYMLASLVLLTILATLAIVAISIYSTTGAAGKPKGERDASAAAIRHLSQHTGKTSPTSTVHTQLGAPYDTLAQLQASAIQAAYAPQHQHQVNKCAQEQAGDYSTGALNRYMAREPYYILDGTSIGLPLAPPSPNSSYIRAGLDSMSPYGTAGDHSASSTLPNSNTPHHQQSRQAHLNRAFIPQNSNSLVVKGRRYNTYRRPDHVDNSVL